MVKTSPGGGSWFDTDTASVTSCSHQGVNQRPSLLAIDIARTELLDLKGTDIEFCSSVVTVRATGALAAVIGVTA